MSIFDEITQAPDPGPEPRGPGKCPTPGCEELESGWSPTGQCPKCVDEAHAEAERDLVKTAVVDQVAVFKMLEPSHDCPCGNRFYETVNTCPACGRPQWCES